MERPPLQMLLANCKSGHRTKSHFYVEGKWNVH